MNACSSGLIQITLPSCPQSSGYVSPIFNTSRLRYLDFLGWGMIIVLIVAAGPPIDAFTLVVLRIEGTFESIMKVDVSTDHIGGDHRRLRRRPRVRP
jgi:hypothetical protein